MSGEGDQDAVLSLFDPAFTFESLLASGDPTLEQPAVPPKGLDSSSSLDDSTVPCSHSGEFGLQNFRLTPEPYQSHEGAQDFSVQEAQPFSDPHLVEGLDPSKQRARATQARFRLREKERRRMNEAKLRELGQQLQQMTLDKKHLEYSNRRLESALKHNDAHLVRLESHLGVRKIEQQICLESLARFVNSIDGIGTDLEALDVIKQWPLRSLEAFHLRYIGRLQQLLSIQIQPSEPHLAALLSVIKARRLHLSTDPYFSSLYWASLCWNVHRQQQSGLQPPGRHIWAQLLTQLRLSPEQQEQMLAARKRLLHTLDAVGHARWDIIVQLGQAALELGRDNLAESPVVEALRQSLDNERTACSDFLYSVTDEVLTPQQEALSEVSSYPWHMDFLELCHILAGRHNLPMELPAGINRLQAKPSGLSRLLPLYSAYQLLILSLPCYCLGMYLKKGVILCPFQTVIPSKCYHLVDLDVLQRMNLFHAHYGQFEDTVFSCCTYAGLQAIAAQSAASAAVDAEPDFSLIS
ncbi:hypothetical protein WJX74_004982 [Apatococcus lobatus]|uniref:BZIP domain-containing protein n=1 Tax=Apatococcus lobatus TaxID=904363 RepID=A0AAW1QLH3_9CHLO